MGIEVKSWAAKDVKTMRIVDIPEGVPFQVTFDTEVQVWVKATLENAAWFVCLSGPGRYQLYSTQQMRGERAIAIPHEDLHLLIACGIPQPYQERVGALLITSKGPSLVVVPSSAPNIILWLNLDSWEIQNEPNRQSAMVESRDWTLRWVDSRGHDFLSLQFEQLMRQ